MSSVMQIKSSRALRAKRFKKNKAFSANWSKFFFRLCLLSFLAGVFWTFFFSSLLAVTQVRLQKTERVDAEQIQSLLAKEMQKKRWKFMPSNNLFLIDSEKMKEEIIKNFIYVDAVEIKRIFPDQLLVKIKERKDIIIFSSGQKDYLLDETGTIFSEINSEQISSMQAMFLQVYNENQSFLTLGQKTGQSNFSTFCNQARTLLKQRLNLELENQLHIPSIMAKELHLRAKDGWEIRLNTLEPIEKQVEKLALIIEKEITPARMSQLEYIDLSLKGKAVYKLKEAVKSEIEENEQLKASGSKEQKGVNSISVG